MSEQNQLLADFMNERRVSTPIVLIKTADQWVTQLMLAKALLANGVKNTAVLTHDVVHGLRAWEGSEDSAAAFQKMGLQSGDKSASPVAVLAAAETLMPEKTVLFMQNAHRHVIDMPTRFLQAVSNLRDELKRNKRMLVLMAPDLTVPAELEGDIVVLEQARPTPAELERIVVRQHENAKKGFPELPMPTQDTTARVVAALSGLKEFEAEGVVVSTIEKTGINVPRVYSRKVAAINNTEGLSVVDEVITFEQIGGLNNIKNFYRLYDAGPNKPDGVVFIDELEKDTAGMKGDNTGVAQRQHKALLTNMQDHKARGVIHTGQSGAGKSAIAKALGALFGVPVIALNLGDLLGSHVGQSETMTRNALKTINGMCKKPLYVATCNDFGAISAELRARFKNGTFYFDLPTREERDVIWKLYLAKYGRKLTEKRPHDRGWVGREIEACVDQAYSLNCSIEEAGQYIVPQATAMREVVASRRDEANGSIISASYEGPFRLSMVEKGERETVGASRTVDLD